MTSSPIPGISADAGLLQAVLEVSLTATLFWVPCYEGDGATVVDFTLEYLNPAGQQLFALPDWEAYQLLTHFPQTRLSGLFDFYRRVMETGEAGTFDAHSPHSTLNSFFRIAARRHGPRLVVSVAEIAAPNHPAGEAVLHTSPSGEQARPGAGVRQGGLPGLFEQAPVGVAIFRGPRYVIEWANPTVCAMWGRTPAEAVGAALFDLLPEAANQGFEQRLDAVLATGLPHVAHEVPSIIYRRGRHDTVYWSFVYQPLYAANGQVTGITVVATDATEQVVARQQVRQLNTELTETNAGLADFVIERTQEAQEARAEAERQQHSLHKLFMNAPVAIVVLSGPELLCQLVNPAYQQLFRGRDLVNKTVLEALPELADTAIPGLLAQVYQTGETYVAHEMPLLMARSQGGALETIYWTFTYQARRNSLDAVDGVIVFAFDVTATVTTRQLVVETQLHVQALAQQLATLGTQLAAAQATLGAALGGGPGPAATAG